MLSALIPAGLALAAPAETPTYLPPPPPVPACQRTAMPCASVVRHATAARAQVRAKLRSGGAVLNAAKQGMRELLGFGDPGNPLRWNPASGLWGGYSSYATSNKHPDWWQSAIATWTLVRYLEATGSTSPAYQDVLDRTFELNVSKPGSAAPVNFASKFMDDTGWWGIAWAEAARYELMLRGDETLAARYLQVAEYDAEHMAEAPRICNGIVWKTGYPPDTISNAEFGALAADLYSLRHAAGPFKDPALAARWLGDARWAVRYLRSTGLIDTRSGVVHDSLNRGCRPEGGPLTYTEGETADAYIGLGAALHKPAYFAAARKFLDYTMAPQSYMSPGGVLAEYCEGRAHHCHSLRQFDVSSFKGIFVQAVGDYDQATGTRVYRPWLQRQASAILTRATSDGTRRSSCTTPHTCQFGLYWSRTFNPAKAPVPGSLATQVSALQALTAELAG